jgi:DNA-binding NarL/FixJ family response regulator
MNIVILTRQPVLALGIQVILTPYPEFTPVVVGADDPDAMQSLRASQPGILLIDFTADDDFGLLLRVRRELPGFKVVIWTRSISPEVAYQAVKLGVKAIFRSSLPAQTFLQCIREVAGGALWFDKELNTSFVDVKTVTLSPRETQLVIMISQGLKNKEIAAALGLSDATIRIYMSALFRKIGAKDRYELAMYGVRQLLSEPPGSAEPLAKLDAAPGRVKVVMLERPRTPPPEPRRLRALPMTARFAAKTAGT